jgi:drug/metabolite transporter (DMT)-like permease
MLAFRFSVAFLIMTLLLIFKVIKVNYRGKNLKWLFILGLFQPILYFIFETKGIDLLPSSQAGIMIASVPMVVLALAMIFLNERTSFKRIVFIVLSILGVAVINMNNLATGNLLGAFYLSIAVFAAAVYNVLSRKLHMAFTAIEMTYLMMGMGAIIFNAVSIINHIQNHAIADYFLPIMNIKAVIGFLYLGVLSSIVAFFVLNYYLSKVEASRVAVFANFTTVISVLAGIVLLKEPFTWQQLVGGIMILVGVYFTQKVD